MELVTCRQVCVGVQARIHNEASLAIYVHYSGHYLNLVISR